MGRPQHRTPTPLAAATAPSRPAGPLSSAGPSPHRGLVPGRRTPEREQNRAGRRVIPSGCSVLGRFSLAPLLSSLQWTPNLQRGRAVETGFAWAAPQVARCGELWGARGGQGEASSQGPQLRPQPRAPVQRRGVEAPLSLSSEEAGPLRDGAPRPSPCSPPPPRPTTRARALLGTCRWQQTFYRCDMPGSRSGAAAERSGGPGHLSLLGA